MLTQLQAVGLSLLIEVPIVVLVSRTPRWRVAAVAVAATLVTHPVVWHGVPGLRPWLDPWWARVAVLEVFAWAAEAGIFAWQLGWGLPRAVAISGLANGASFGFGLWWTAPVCPAGTARDPARAAQVAAVLGRSPGRVCFGAVHEGGVRSGSWIVLDGERDPRWLAARVVHLEQHRASPPAGPGCADALRAEEAEGWARELALRQALGVVDGACPVTAALGATPTVQAVDGWLAGAPDPLAVELRASHARRCAVR